MKITVLIFVATTIGLLALAASPTADAGQASAPFRVPTPEQPKPLAGTIICRGGPALVWDKPREIADLSRAPAKEKRLMIGLIFQIARGPAGPQALGLKPSECGFVDRPWPTSVFAPPLVFFDAASAEFDIRSGASGVYARRSSIQEHLTDINHFWSFDVTLKSFYFDADTHRLLDAKAGSAFHVPLLTEARDAPGTAKAKAVPKHAGPAGAASENTGAMAAPVTGERAADAIATAEEGVAFQQADESVRTGTAKRSPPAELSNAGTALINVPGESTAHTQPLGGRLPGAERAAALKRDCTSNPPRISNIQGAVRPGGTFTIHGACFGTQTGGYVEIIGQFEGGTLKRTSVEWQDHAIVVEMPLLTDVPDHTVAISVRRGVDAKQSTARHARFVAARRSVEVPAELWSPSGRYAPADEVTTVHSDVLKQTSFNESYVERRTSSFRVKVNPACALETLDVPATVGRVRAVDGWEGSPSNEADVRVTWSPACKIHTRDYVVAAKHSRLCSVAFELKARASCPAGVNVAP